MAPVCHLARGRSPTSAAPSHGGPQAPGGRQHAADPLALFSCQPQAPRPGRGGLPRAASPEPGPPHPAELSLEGQLRCLPPPNLCAVPSLLPDPHPQTLRVSEACSGQHSEHPTDRWQGLAEGTEWEAEERWRGAAWGGQGIAQSPSKAADTGDRGGNYEDRAAAPGQRRRRKRRHPTATPGFSSLHMS